LAAQKALSQLFCGPSFKSTDEQHLESQRREPITGANALRASLSSQPLIGNKMKIVPYPVPDSVDHVECMPI
jgi:hypothetical protein